MSITAEQREAWDREEREARDFLEEWERRNVARFSDPDLLEREGLRALEAWEARRREAAL